VFGIKKKLEVFKELALELKKITIAPKNSNTNKFTNTKLVIEKSKQNNLIVNKTKIKRKKIKGKYIN
jgi:hypothetical protein